MGLSYTPVARIYGAHAEMINQRLLTWGLVDAAGLQSDQLTLQVDTEGVEGLPKEGQTIGLELGYAEDAALTDKGKFKITRLTPRLYPDSVTIVATAAAFQVADETEFKRRRSRSFEDITLGDLFRQVIAPHGYSPRVATDLGRIKLAHVDQSDETDMSFLTRLAKRYDAVSKPVDQLYVLARRGQVKSLSGQNLPSVRYSLPTNNVPSRSNFIGAEADFASRPGLQGVVVVYWDADAGKEVELRVGESPFKKLRNQYESELQAAEAANGELRKLMRTGVTIRMDVPGNPNLVAEGLLELDNTFPIYMRGRWSLDRVTSRGSRGEGYRCSLEATEPL
ncbi:MAG: phage late control D family protein [Gammaproteobacteria bacterium]|nr:phage late control D family protein [Gammaproteobacteria bacterium]